MISLGISSIVNSGDKSDYFHEGVIFANFANIKFVCLLKKVPKKVNLTELAQLVYNLKLFVM